jgi:hypothetical protein
MQVKQHWRVVKLLLICSSKQQKLYFHGTEQKQSLCIMPWDTCYLMIPCYSTCPKESVQLLFGGHQPASMFLSCSSDVRQQSGGLQLAAKASGS